MMPPNFQPHSEGLIAFPEVLFALHLGYTCQDPPNPLAHQCHQLQKSRKSGNLKGQLTQSSPPPPPKATGKEPMFSGVLAKLESPSLRVPTHGCRTRPPVKANVSANACSARNASLQLLARFPIWSSELSYLGHSGHPPNQ